jgi:hypothetical protein
MRLGVYLFASVLLATLVGAQTPSEKRLISRMKAAPVSKIDSALPEKPFDAWLRALVVPDTPMYEVDDCGERNGTPDEQGKEFPTCVHVTAKASSVRQVDLRFIVATYVVPRKNKPSPPEKSTEISLFLGEVSPSNSESKQPTVTLGKLSDLPNVLQGKR